MFSIWLLTGEYLPKQWQVRPLSYMDNGLQSLLNCSEAYVWPIDSDTLSYELMNYEKQMDKW